MEKRTEDNPWHLKTPPLSSDYTMHMGERDGIEAIVCTVGKTVLYYDARAINDLHQMLLAPWILAIVYCQSDSAPSCRLADRVQC